MCEPLPDGRSPLYFEAYAGISVWCRDPSRTRQEAREALDAWVREVVAWHFDPATGCPFWLDTRKKLGWDPRERDHGLRRPADASAAFEDEWLRGGPVQRWVPKGCAGKPVFVFETGGTTGVPEDAHHLRRLPHRLRALQRRRCPTSTSRRARTG